jgi:glycerol-3-phosphate dehydrogenase
MVPTYDLLIIGGGINGAGIARDAAGRGLSVLLVEKDDLAAHTSSASSRLIHGGLRYLEHFDFRLVAASLAEREVLLKMAPHVIHPLRFVLPHAPHLRPAWMIRIGLFLYDRLGGRSSLPRSKSVALQAGAMAGLLQPQFTRGFEYADAWADDARLVALNARGAADKGATILTNTACIAAQRNRSEWTVKLRNERNIEVTEVKARVVVNAAGPWAERVLNEVTHTPTAGRLRLVRGSHIVVARLYEGDHAYILQNEDKRIVFLLPYLPGLTVIGTTDQSVASPDIERKASPEEIAYLLDIAGCYLKNDVRHAPVLDSWAGVRALYDDGETDPSAITRDYRLVIDDRGPPILSVLGGKITTYRKLAEDALTRLAKWIPTAGPSWTAIEPLPGGDLDRQPLAAFIAAAQRKYAGLDPALVASLVLRHGANIGNVLRDSNSMAALGEHFGGQLYEREVRYLHDSEWAQRADDVLWRRTKEGYACTPAQVERLNEWMAREYGGAKA